MKYPCSHYQDVSLTSCGDTMVSTANQATAECVMDTKILCFDFMTTLFEPPNFVFGRQYNSNDNNSMYPWSSSSSEESSSPSDKENNNSNSNYSTSLTPKRICKMWKKKRKTEKMKLRELQQQEQRQDKENRDHDKVDIVSDFQLASETKQSAQQIQRRFEKKFDQNNYSQRHERYGNLVDFTPGLRKVKSSVPHL